MHELEKINKSALEYALYSTQRMQEISAPLKKYLGIKSFSYMRTYPDCSYLSLLDGYEEYSKKFFETIPKSDPHFIEAINNTPYGEAHFTLWPVSPTTLTPILSLLDAYNMWHGFQITYRREEYCEMFSFTFDKQTDDKSAFYIKNIPVLLKFINYFKAQALDLIENNDKNKLAIFPEKFTTEYLDNTNNKLFLSDLNQDLVIKNFEGDITHLTSRESECLKIFSQNKTCKEIAQILAIAPRTVELHIQNIKHKLKINYKNQLFELYRKNFITG
jgi:DNA-binding CsgD family transcriptional regulator